MRYKINLKKRFILPVFGLFLLLISNFLPVMPVHAVPENPAAEAAPVDAPDNTGDNQEHKNDENTSSQKDSKKDTEEGTKDDESTKDDSTENTEGTDTEDQSEDNGEQKADETCYDQVGSIGWLICPATGAIAKATDAIYGVIESLLTVKPLTTDDGSPIYIVWQYARDITNIIFVIMLLVVVWSHLTGIGLSNYNIKKILPRIVVTAVLVNLSFLICSLAVDISNILGVSLRGFFSSIQNDAINASSSEVMASQISWTSLSSALIGGGTVAGLAISFSGGLGAFLWLLVGAVLAALFAVFTGLITIALRQALVSVLVMVSSLAFVSYLLPNTEKWFNKWKNMLFSMLFFFPMFSVLFGAAKLAGWAIIVSGNGNILWVILGMAVQVIPLYLSVSLLKMSGTVLGAVSSKLSGLTSRPSSSAKDWAAKNREAHRQRYLANSYMPAAGLRRYLDGRQRLREIDTENSIKNRNAKAEKYAQGVLRGNKNYNATAGYGTDKKIKRNRIYLRDENGRIKRDKDGGLMYSLDAQGFRTNRFTRNAMQVNTNTMEAENATKDTTHVLNNYSTYHGRKASDRRISARTLEAYKNVARTNFTAINDNEADVDFLVNSYLDIASGKKYKNKGKKFDPYETPEYKHFIRAAGGGLGEKGAESVLAQTIAMAAKNESRHRKETHILQSKFQYNKGEARAMYAGYYVNDDGIATDEEGKEIKVREFLDETTGKIRYVRDDKDGRKESSPGEFLKKCPGLLVPYTQKDENGDVYFKMKDQKGNFVTRIYKKDGAAVKELLTNFDMPINDPINGLYGILAGIEDGDNGYFGKLDFERDRAKLSELGIESKEQLEDLKNIGLARFSTTIGRGMLSARFKEKAAFAGPMYATSVMNRYVQDYVHQNLARLDNLLKTAKAGSFNVQDNAELGQLIQLMDPENWKNLFPLDSLQSYRNVNGESLKGTRTNEKGEFLDKDGNVVDFKHAEKISCDKATQEELFATVRGKWLIPLAPKLAAMMSRYTQNTADNQKPGTDEQWQKFKEVLEKYNDEEYINQYNLKDPYAKQTGFPEIAREIKNQIHPRANKNHQSSQQPATQDHSAYIDSNNASSSENIIRNHQTRSNDENANPEALPNFARDLEDILDDYSNDPETCTTEIVNYLEESSASNPRFNSVYNAFYELSQQTTLSIDDLRNEVENLIACFYSEE